MKLTIELSPEEIKKIVVESLKDKYDIKEASFSVTKELVGFGTQESYEAVFKGIVLKVESK